MNKEELAGELKKLQVLKNVPQSEQLMRELDSLTSILYNVDESMSYISSIVELIRGIKVHRMNKVTAISMLDNSEARNSAVERELRKNREVKEAFGSCLKLLNAHISASCKE